MEPAIVLGVLGTLMIVFYLLRRSK
ncbi:MAG TPA: PEP-CTERM sorting domain-containing protein [Candidatus Aerophobetes bacterium]|uniref:PEP-CTERM sorting domain-containing protein n=1 Tax=Aerophobetes bacterium TaxID=2030807 RepID=A0A7C1M825_UNCAE|nr:PEP-CTERM sorting domain-containing protein [Candidatus Aerophobetes bacterium]